MEHDELSEVIRQIVDNGWGYTYTPKGTVSYRQQYKMTLYKDCNQDMWTVGDYDWKGFVLLVKAMVEEFGKVGNK